MGSEIASLQKIAKRWGGEIRQVSEAEFAKVKARLRSFSEAPFSAQDLGVDWHRRRILYVDDPGWAAIIHEMGHTFACDIHPTNSDEFEFLGWEFLMAQHIGADLAEWVKQNKDYQVSAEDFDPMCKGKGESFAQIGDLTKTQFDSMIQTRIEVAKQIGLTRGNKPRAIR